METLRSIMRSYIVQIDSLNTKNQALTAENIEVRTKLRDVEKSHEELSKIKDELSSKVNLASQLSAKDIIVSEDIQAVRNSLYNIFSTKKIFIWQNTSSN